ncbi:MAG TPA: imidazolonepropionase [Chloroflexi bacterium]|nr:imidazolonepropionase [Chloroflexota bacterium]
MPQSVDLVIFNTSQIVTCASPNGPKRGTDLRDVDLLEDGAIAVAGEKIVAVGPRLEILAQYRGKTTLNAAGMSVCPGFVDPHTHVVYAGDRVEEFELRIQGASYMEIMAAGGGIMSTAQAVRSASISQLVAESCRRLDAMLRLGTTTAEIKTGYGLETNAELKMLAAIAELDQTHPISLLPTFLGAHAVPQEYAGRTEAYTRLVIDEMLPAASAWYQKSHFRTQGIPLFCDVFCENGAFDLAQSRQILEAGLTLGLQPKIHADEFTNLGGVALAVELGAVSVDHLDVTPQREWAILGDSDTVGVVLPAVNFNLGSPHFADARGLIDSGAALALSTDINPGSAPCPSMPLVMAIAARYQRLLPAEALNASTINAAYAIKAADQVGSIEAGKQADLLILRTPDYRHLAYQFGENLVGTVIKKGQVLDLG